MQMRQYRLGSSGLHVSALGLGTNAFGKRADAAESVRIVHAALDQGITFIDTANIYAGTESERLIGQALAGGRRHEAILATKAGLPRGQGPNERGASRHHLMRELEGSLQRLQTDYIDLYQIHTFDPNTPLDETLRCLDDMVRAGKVRYIGASNYAAWEMMKALGVSERLGLNRYVSNQICYSLADRSPEREIVPMSLDAGIGIIPYYPLAGGILTGKYSGSAVPKGSRADTDPNFRRFLTENRLQLGNAVSRIAAELGCAPGALAIAWLMNRPAVSSVIVGVTSVAQMEENLAAVTLELSEEVLRQLDDASAWTRYSEPFAEYRLQQSDT
jgi:aryl-alcohol dehydrogenase-like predicted oxidoreductase